MRHGSLGSRSVYRRALLAGTVLLLAGALVAPLGSASAGEATQLPLSDFLSEQGTTTLFLLPVGDYIGWSGRPPSYPHLGSMDYAGLANEWLKTQGYDLGTQVSGSLLRRDVDGGMVQYDVTLHTTSALSFMVKVTSDPPLDAPLEFGARAQEVANGAMPALGDCHFHAVWLQDAGEPIPDLVKAAVLGDQPAGWDLIAVSFQGNASGTIHADAELGYVGPGRMVIAQTGILSRGSDQGADTDGFPVEVVDLHPTGN